MTRNRHRYPDAFDITEYPEWFQTMAEALGDKWRDPAILGKRKTDEEIDAEHGPDTDDDEDRTPYRLTEDGIEEEIERNKKRRGLQKVG